MERTAGILSARFHSQFFLCFLLSFLSMFVILYSIPCHAVSEQGEASIESDADTDANADSETDFDYQPGEICVKDRSVRAGLLYDMAADAIVWEKNRNESLPIASLTKMMVALIAMEDIFAGKVDLDTTVKVTPESAKMNGSKVYLKTGCCVSVEELLKAALISSGNDAAYLLAQFLGGTESAFVHRMNQRAARLGMKSTFYSNSTGMPAIVSTDDNRSSPSDLLILAKEILKYDQLREIAGMSDAIITQDQKPIMLRNHNGLVARYEDVDGIKTGFTLNAKYCLVATANKNNRRLICIVLGVTDRGTRNQFVASTISRYYETLGLGGLERKTGVAFASCDERKHTPDASSQKAAAAGASSGKNRFYVAKKGDTLNRIAVKYGCTVAELKSWNHVKGNRVKPGRQLVIYRDDSEIDSNTASPVVQTAAAEPVRAGSDTQDRAAGHSSGSRIIYFYTVRPGDTLWSISQKYEGITVNDIMKTNRIRRIKDLKPGIKLKIETDV